jgi:hypothetical protein
MRVARALFFLVLMAGCSGASGTGDLPQGEPGGSDQGGPGGASGQGGAGQGGASNAGASGVGGGVLVGGSGGGGGGGDDTNCGEGVGKVIYVVSNEYVLLSFDPATLGFTTIGKLSCPAGFGDTPFSMAVDRNGTAFVLYQSGNIFKVSTQDASCSPSGYKPNQQGWERFGMAYVSDAAGSNSETLFVIDGTGLSGLGSNKGLGKISQSGQLSTVGQFNQGLAGRTAEVTGLGDGRLFGFFVDSSKDLSSVAEIDKNTGDVLTNEPQALPPINAWAFAHWGGSFYLFNGDGLAPSRVHRYTPGKGTELVVQNAGYSIVGAGVSTCAPTTPIIN